MSAQDSPIKPQSVSVDEVAALAALDGQRELLKELAVMFCEDAPTVVEELRKAVDSEDHAEARRAVHSLKGLAATFFAKPTVELAHRLEDEAASENLTQLSNGGVEEMAESIRMLARELKNHGLVE